jgi:hypothetical protein
MSLPELELTDDGSHYLYDGKPLERVTQIIHKAMPPYLAPWAEKVGQRAMYEVIMKYNDKEHSFESYVQEIREAGLTCDDEKTKGADRGQALHQAIEAMIETGEPAVDLDDFENPEHAKYAQSFAAFMVDYRPTFERAEIRVCQPELGYAGTFDAIATCRARPKGARGTDLTGKRIILDWKTNVGKKVYESHLYQLAAYQLAMDYWDEPVEGAAVVALGPMGDIKGKPYSFKPNHVEPEAFEAMVKWCRVVERQKTLNPLARKK